MKTFVIRVYDRPAQRKRYRAVVSEVSTFAAARYEDVAVTWEGRSRDRVLKKARAYVERQHEYERRRQSHLIQEEA